MNNLSKKIYNSLKVCFLLFNFSTNINAQKNEILLSEAHKSFQNYAFIDAREIYLEVAKKGFASADLYSKIADSYYLNSDFKNALIWYNRLINKYEKELNSEYLFRYAQCLKSTEQYKKSDKIMKKALLKSNIDQHDLLVSENSKDYYLNLIEKQSGKFEIDTLDINTEYSEHSPSFAPTSQLAFSSSRGGGAIYEWDNMPFLDLYIAKIDENKNTPVRINGDVNTKVHESSSVFTKDGKTMYFTRNNYFNKKLKRDGTGSILLKLYRAELIDNKWQKITELPFNSDEYSIAHPALSNDEKELFFTSDMPGSYGDSDIYKVVINDDNTYGTPKNLGETINTTGKETFPFISQTGDLYFSSNGHLGLGGLDVFISTKTKQKYNKPYNIGKPINGPFDDFSFIINTKNKTGYFSSNRPNGKGSDDIYSFTQIAPLNTNCKQYFRGILIDDNTEKPISGATVQIFNNETNKSEYITSGLDGSFIFLINCNENKTITIENKNYVPKQTTAKASDQNKKFIDKTIRLHKNILHHKKIEKGDDLAKALEMNPIYFDLNKYQIRKDAKIELQKIVVLLKKFPDLKIEIRSHTDSRADDLYNLKLSKNRAYTTRNYLVKKGDIEASRISYQGYGESKIVNNCTNGIPCNENRHQENRRCEFILIN